jgi:peroxiredoxin
VAGGLLALGHAALGAKSARMPAPPFALPGPLRSALPVPADSPSPRLTVALYVTASCPFCRAELAHWGTLADRFPELFRFLRVVVIAPDPPRAADTTWLPRALPHARVRDAHGDIARALGVRAVPVTLYLDPADTVRDLTVGERPPEVTLRRVEALLRSQEAP